MQNAEQNRRKLASNRLDLRYYPFVDYYPRTVDRPLTELLEAMGGVLVQGPRGCGKTATSLKHSRSSIRFDASPQLVRTAELAPRSLLAGATPRLLDEWQLAPDIWNAARHEIDSRREPGQFIFSGSASPLPDKSRHSGAGRIARLTMRTMTLSERRASSDQISFQALRSGTQQVQAMAALDYEELAEQAVRGGWPGLLDRPTGAASIFNQSYCADLADAEISAPGLPAHNPARMRQFLASLARNISQQPTLRTLASDVSGSGTSISVDTVRAYLDALTRVFAVEEVPAWSPALRSRSRLRAKPKLHLADPALACAAIGMTPERLRRDPEYFGQIFESMVVHDLRVYAEAQGGQVFHYRDNTELEIDAIIEYSFNDWAAVEVELGWRQIPEAEKNLLTLRDERVDPDRVGRPAFLAVITGTESAYTLPSGVHVVPLATLTA
jgi:predicted AAA+ superfamily ATPase